MSPLPHMQEFGRLSCLFIEVQILDEEDLTLHLSLFQYLQQCLDSHFPIESPSTLGTSGKVEGEHETDAQPTREETCMNSIELDE